MDSKEALVVFEGAKIRRIWHDDQWFFAVVDIIQILTDSPTPRQYWGKIKDREFALLELSPIWVQLKLPAEDGKLRFTDCINTQNAFRLIQSIPYQKQPLERRLMNISIIKTLKKRT